MPTEQASDPTLGILGHSGSFFLHLSPYEVDTTINPILQVGKLRLRQVKQLAQSPTMSKQQSWDLDPVLSGPKHRVTENEMKAPVF